MVIKSEHIEIRCDLVVTEFLNAGISITTHNDNGSRIQSYLFKNSEDLKNFIGALQEILEDLP
jgi:hypothetical protein